MMPARIKGFTAIELLIVVVIMLVLITLTVMAFNITTKGNSLANTQEEILNILRRAQNRAIASEGDSQYGVHFEAGKYVLFKGVVYNSFSTDNEVYNMPEDIEIYQISLFGGGSEAVFKKINGQTDQPGIVGARLVSDPSKNKIINIEASGRIFTGTETSPSDLPEKDSRHLHCDFGWSMQNATALKFVFLGPAPDQTEIVNTAGYFNIGKTDFNWGNEGSPFQVLGVNQGFLVPTHYLDAFNTVLSIRRDRNNGSNDQEVIIYMVDGADREIVHYLGDAQDTAVKGVNCSTMTIQ